MARIGIMVSFTIKPGCWQAFDAHIRKHAAATLDEEPGCEAFDLLGYLAEVTFDGNRIGADLDARLRVCVNTELGKQRARARHQAIPALLGH